jgi:hypothetical protein
MAIYRMTGNELEALEETTFADVSVSERGDLQRLLKRKIEIIAPGILIVSEEFSDWEDSRRRIDLLGIDASANLVVIELKRTEDDGHMELQAIRYAAMVSTLSFDRVVEIFEAYLAAEGDTRDARTTILDHLGWEDADQDAFAQDVKIVLASAEFSKELTTTVMWLNDEFGLDIRCVRIKPYGSRDNLLLDVQQVIPLPEAQEYQVRLKDKKQKERGARTSSRDVARFNVSVDGVVHQNLPKRRAVFTVIHAICSSGISPVAVSAVLSWRKKLLLSVDGTVDSAALEALARQQSSTFDPIRWFYEDSELIHADGKTYALTNQWGPRGEQAMQQLLNELHLDRISFERIS